MRPELQNALTAAKNLPPEDLPRLLGDLEEIRTTAMARLYSQPAPAERDQVLDVDAASRMLGQSPSWLYDHHHELPFTRRLPGSISLGFSRLGIEKYLRARTS